MKKTILSLIAIATLSFTAAAQTAATSTDPVVQTQQQEQKTEVLMKDLSKQVKEGWEKSEYKSEDVEKIYKVKTQEEEYIEFIVKTEQNKKSVQFDLNGKFLREKVIDTK